MSEDSSSNVYCSLIQCCHSRSPDDRRPQSSRRPKRDPAVRLAPQAKSVLSTPVRSNSTSGEPHRTGDIWVIVSSSDLSGVFMAGSDRFV